MTRDEQAQLCYLLAKLRYDMMIDSCKSDIEKQGLYNDYIAAINKVMSYSYVDYEAKEAAKNEEDVNPVCEDVRESQCCCVREQDNPGM